MHSNEKKYMLTVCIAITLVVILIALVFKINLLILLPISLLLTFRRMSIYNYKIENNNLIFIDGLILKSTKTVPFDRINEVILRENIVSKCFNVCSMIIITNSSFLWLKYINKNTACRFQSAIFGEIK